MKRTILSAAALSMAWGIALADIVVEGTVVDKQGEPLIGATVRVAGTNIATAADLDGRFRLRVPDKAKELTIDYVGFDPLKIGIKPKMGEVVLTAKETMLQDVVVTQSLARTRKTPVAISNISAPEIEARLGNQEFPEVLKTTPGVWATKDGGGYGDAKINMRGFKTENIAALINGIPVNDMEWGGLYWSNWAGLSDVTASMQTQRGLGAAIISSPSVGGTINITTRSLDVKRGGNIFYGMGNDGMNHIGFSLSTGLMKNGWAVTVMGSRKWGDGYVQGTNFNAYTYFVNISKRINERHQLSFTAFGSPQTHNRRTSANGLTIMGWQDVKQYMNGESMYKYNPTFGYDNEGQVRSSSLNVYHKPQISLNHIWQINHKSSLSSAVYASFASGYGSSGQGRGTYNGTALSYSSWYGANNGILTTLFRRPDGTFDYGAIQDMNAASETGSNMIMARSGNNHTWIGLVSTYKNELIQNKLNLLAGIDVRYYVGYHKNTISDLYSGAYFIDDGTRKGINPANNAAAANPAWVYEKLGVGDVVYRNYTGHTAQEGAYLQLEYQPFGDKLTTILAGSLNNTTYWRYDRLYYDEEHAMSEKPNFMAGNIKAGINWNIDRHNNVYVNGGYLTRAPFFSKAVFFANETSNTVNKNAVNEKCGTVEIGYEYHSPQFTAVVNGYFTKWLDKTASRVVEMNNGDNAFFNMSGVNARHMGLEINAVYKPVYWLDINGMVSLGDWIWDSNATGYFYNSYGQPLANTKGDLASGVLAPDHAKAVLNQKGRKVGGSAQSTGYLGVNVRPFKGLRIGIDWTCSARNYSDFSISASQYAPGATISVGKPWRIPWGNQLDLSCSYNFKISGLDATIFGNVYNVAGYNYVMDAYTDATKDGAWDNAYRTFYSFGRTYALRLKIAF
ncbi:MAG: TonB-dependent receptor [Muribaculaceae bacterium]|nr:TonB-dependent receptor [Muribaculaceae bacterium]